MDKVLKFLTLENFKGSRTKISLLVAGLIGILAHFGIVTPELANTIISLGAPFGLFFAVEHWEPKK